MAAEDERINQHVRFVNFFGGYYDAEDLVKAVVTASRFSDGMVEPWHPNKLSVEVVRTHLIEGLSDPEERRLLMQAFVSGRPSGGLSLEPGSLSPEATAVYELLSGPSLEEVDALMERLPEATQDSLRAISPRTGIGRLKARLLAMHDREDDLVPSEESRRIVAALGDGPQVYHTEFSFFQHVDPTASVSLPRYVAEAYKLFLHMYNVMSAF